MHNRSLADSGRTVATLGGLLACFEVSQASPSDSAVTSDKQPAWRLGMLQAQRLAELTQDVARGNSSLSSSCGG